MNTLLIYDLLPTGKENRVRSDELVRAAGLPDKRALCSRIRRERLDGALILSTKEGGGGYYKPATVAEVNEFIASYSGEARALFSMLAAARKHTDRIEGQLELAEIEA